MKRESETGAGYAQETQSEVVRASARFVGSIKAAWAGLRDAYYGGIDELERALCAP